MFGKFYCLIILGALCATANASPLCRDPEWFLCSSGTCIQPLFQCDTENDCGDWSDEKNCDNFTLSIPLQRCAQDEYQCLDHACIPIEKFCDYYKDCPDASDEFDGCVEKLNCTGSRCKDRHCVRNEWICDGIADCADKSDEVDCGTKIVSTEECTSENDRFLCENKRCIFLSATCNKKNDCGDGSDENVDGCAKAEEACTKTARCNQFCRRTPAGAVCSCQPGYKLATNETCKDVNECAIYGACDQQCINNDGAYVCACRSGYILQADRRTCKVEGGEALMVFSTKSEIQGYYLHSQVHFSAIRNLQHAVSVSLDGNHIYWSDIEDGEEAIFKSLDDGSRREVIVSAGLGRPENIAVDWVTGNIYFTDGILMHIGVCTNNGSYCTVLIKAQSGNPRGLALLPSDGILYWSEWDLNSGSHISVAGMDGKDVMPFINSKLDWPNDLTIDYPNERLYWVDGKSKKIESVRLDGSDRRIILANIAKHPFSLGIFENKLYWSDWSTNTIQYCDKNTGKDWETLLRQNSTVYGIHIYHSVLMPKMHNPCGEQPCSQLCLLSRNNGHTCACTLDRELSADQRTCRVIQKKEHILIAAGNKFMDYYHEILGTPKIMDNILMRRVTAMAYNSLTGTIFASDQLADKIFHYDPQTGNTKSMVSLKSEVLGGMDFDYIGNNLYVTDIMNRTIEVHSLSTSEKTVFYFQEQPHDIALVPNKGLMFVVFRINEKYRIERMQMNGIGSTLPITEPNLIGPKISLCYDRDTGRLFWSDQGTGRIESTTVEGTDRHLFRTGLDAPVSLMVLKERIFWTQFKSDSLYWTNKNSTYQFQKRVPLPNVPKDVNKMELVAIHGAYVTQDHPCRQNNGKCSHVCLVSNNNFHTCACPPDMMLNADNRTCNSQNPCGPGEEKCGHQNACIKRRQLCDGKVDCPNGEDEAEHCAYLSACGKTEFRCKSGGCISLQKRCNSHYDCTDRSDEEGCEKKECKTNEFQCREGNCISDYSVCDGHNDCPDFSDEINCDAHSCDIHDYTCKNKNCIPMTWVCDGQNDCEDNSDEGEICKAHNCSSEMFTCHNGRCLDSRLRCNGANDCGDGSDEEQCSAHRSAYLANCTRDQYNCYDSKICIPLKQKCNGVQDCPRNDDELGCPSCQKDEFACDNGRCITQSWVCDMTDDCGDRSDEKDCSGDNSRRKTVDTSFDCEEFRCESGECLSYSMVCDGVPNCRDQSDERGKCALACVSDNPCENICHKTPNGPACGCRSGYRLSADGKSCVDIDECETDPCSHMCQNTVGSFVCSCYEGYALRSDKTSCKATGQQLELITVVKNSIRSLTPTLSKIEIVHEELNFDVTGIEVDAHKNTIYWSNDILGTITKMNLNTKAREIVTGIGKPYAVAVDWISNNVYFNDNSAPSNIKVCNLEQKKCAKLLTIEGSMKPMSIAVSPKHGWLFWSQTSWPVYDDSSSEIYRTDLLGANMTTIAYKHVGVVSGLTIDHMRSRIYWSDSFLKSIETSNFDGSNRQIFMKTDYQPFSINLDEDSLYWLMGNSGKLQKCNIRGNKSCTTIEIGTNNIDRHFLILHNATQPPAKNICENSVCEYMCIPRNNTPVCICEDGYPHNVKNMCAHISNSNVKFVSREKAAHIHQESGTVIAVVITVLTCIIALSAYCYYQKVKPSLAKKNDLSIRFQNPTYERSNEIIVSSLPPGEHEYSNPIINISKNPNSEAKKDPLCGDASDDDSDSAYKQNMKLIN